MSAPLEHIAAIRDAKAARDAGHPSGQQVYQSQIYLFVDVHLDQIAAAITERDALKAALRDVLRTIDAALSEETK